MTLTREQVLEMGAGNHMDRLIALNIMGFEPSNTRDGWVRVGALASYPKQYSTDISAAWEVVEKITSNKDWMLYRIGHTDESGKIEYECTFLQINRGVTGYARDKIAPLAISRAALLSTIA